MTYLSSRRVKCVSSHTCLFYWWWWWLGFGGLTPGGVGLWCCCWPFVVVIWCVLTRRCAGGGHLLSLWSCGSCIHSLKFAKYSKKREKKKPMARDTYACQVIDVWGVVVAVHHHGYHFEWGEWRKKEWLSSGWKRSTRSTRSCVVGVSMNLERKKKYFNCRTHV